MSTLAPEAILAGRYRLVKQLGSGGMAMVWLAEDGMLERRVAVKVPADLLADDKSYLRRFRREAQVAARLSHPNLVEVYDFSDREEKRPFLVMEYVEGDTLEDLSNKGKRIDAERLAFELLSALEHIHAAGIVHRDVKPSNVLVTRDGRARLTDFGIAQPEDATRLTQTGKVIGSRDYMAPEALSGDRATGRSDLYSCGLVLSDHVGRDADPRLRRLVADLTARDPGSRPRSATDALTALEPATDLPARTQTAPTLPHRGVRIRLTPGQGLGALVVVALLTVGLVMLISGEDGESPQQPAAVEAPQGGGGGAASESPDPAEGARLNQEGYQLIQQGQPEEAVPILERAVAAFPQGSTDLNYAFALFNLGQALRLSGRPEEAIPVLEERAKIDNQRETVLAELAKAREEAGE